MPRVSPVSHFSFLVIFAALLTIAVGCKRETAPPEESADPPHVRQAPVIEEPGLEAPVIEAPVIEAPTDPPTEESEPTNESITEAADETVRPAEVEEAEHPADDGPTVVVVLISVDGLRGDYVDMAEAPFFSRLMEEGAFTRELAPVFPSLTFPSHVSMATGARVEDHGIAANALYDFERDRRWSYPSENSTILCEPIWNTAKRQGIRTLVFDWPVSHKQEGPHAADYFNQSYDTRKTDEQRMDQMLDTWERDRNEQPLQLVMGYIPSVDQAGHRYGPDTPETRSAVEEADRLMRRTFERAQRIVDQQIGENALLYFIVTTDHGMDDIHTFVQLKGLAGDAFTDDMRFVTSGSVGNIYLEFVENEEAKPVLIERLLERFRRHSFVQAYARDELPEEWGYDRPGRTGDVVVSIDPGYYFNNAPGPPTRPIEEGEGPVGMHGYPIEDSPEMYGFMGIWRSGEPIGGVDLGTVDCRRVHATVTELLGIEPAEKALNEPLPNLVPGR